MQLFWTFIVLLLHTFSSLQHPEKRKLSDLEHHEDNPEKHNLQFDHEAFLGKELAAEFDKLTDEEAKERLSLLFKKIDQDGNSLLSEEELSRWISFVSKTAIRMDANKHWKNLNQDKNQPLVWRDYLDRTYGLEDEINLDPSRLEHYQKLKRADEKRWNAADTDFDNKLSLDEFCAFLHPQDYPRMRNIVIDETMQGVDKNHDGYVTLNEYLADLAQSYDKKFDPEAPLADWAINEKEQFTKYRDKNKDNRMDREEIGDWIMPLDYDPVDAETKHLFYHADVDKSGTLSEKEVLNNQALFVGSQALNYGRPLEHFEL